jgi:uncharacterized membrane protein HdeD (DUF308 family)
MKKRLLDSYGSLLTDVLIIAMGVLFFIHTEAAWRALYYLTVTVFLFEPTRLIINTLSGFKDHDRFDNLVVVFDYFIAWCLISTPASLPRINWLLLGWWIMGHGVIAGIDFYVRTRDSLPGAAGQLFSAVFSLALAVFLIWSDQTAGKIGIMTVFSGLYFCIVGGTGFLSHLPVLIPVNRRSQYRRMVTFSLPVLLSALMPLHFYISIRSLLKSSRLHNDPADQKSDLYVFLYLNGKGPEIFGHVDISFENLTYSYGCHDPSCRTFFGAVGDGVLMRADTEDFLNASLKGERKIIMRYGIRLTDAEKQILRGRIQELMSRAVPWDCAAAAAERNHQDSSRINDYASKVYKTTHCEMFKFSSGKFRTYFAASTNCVLLADELIRSKNLNLIDIAGFATPGAYLSFLNSQYLLKTTPVRTRTIYEPEAHA